VTVAGNNGTCNIVILFTPSTAGAETATLTVTDDRDTDDADDDAARDGDVPAGQCHAEPAGVRQSAAECREHCFDGDAVESGE
jgi:hypothetical protein